MEKKMIKKPLAVALSAAFIGLASTMAFADNSSAPAPAEPAPATEPATDAAAAPAAPAEEKKADEAAPAAPAGGSAAQ
jgi:5'-nucleotidase